MKERINTSEAPAALGPYSQAIRYGNLVFLSGQIPLNNNNEVVGDNVTDQTHQVFKNIIAVLTAAGTDLSKVVKVTVFLKDMNTFTEMNTVFAQYMPEPYPARSTIEVARLPKDSLVEIECIALVE
ncbi:RidA family protein [Deinococcus cellulosilyticus]|uniref:Endoribonuclease L-PSP n=1 Tax=Deinococcus cellulosilyticus (strain DSM 18568 / NBRC 106333 / KACC 11606 / 5516J-15) TaxID=1223518 RepID=A0A511N7I0_DEIC1|nr:RidA family protein [Deinococcus cellulosilyticus]GEM48426.1 endoribonuclease L-PSP [Deinococcus cellulosilyticus NBRC 106333 = KACC 11606]